MHTAWQVWIIATLTSFAAIEGYAFWINGETLSAFIRELSAEAPIVRDGLCVTVGWLINHFWEH